MEQREEILSMDRNIFLTTLPYPVAVETWRKKRKKEKLLTPESREREREP